MDNKRLVIFGIVAFAIMFGWTYFFPSAPATTEAPAKEASTAAPAQSSPANTPSEASDTLKSARRIKVTTDTIVAEIDTIGADLRQLKLLKHGQIEDVKTPFTLLQEQGKNVYVAQTGLLNNEHPNLPTHRAQFTTSLKQDAVSLPGDQNQTSVRFEAPVVDGIKVAKIYTFTRGSYVIDVRYEIHNGTNQPLNLSSYYRLLRDGIAPPGSDGGFFSGVSSFSGAAVYSEAHKFQKVSFSDVDKNKASYTPESNDGWVGMLQHYFATAWLLSPSQGVNVCAQQKCRFEIKNAGNGLYSAGAIVTLPTIAPNSTTSVSVPLYAGPEETVALEAAAPGLELVKDYGVFTLLAKPMFWMLDKIYQLVGNWGWAIVLFTCLIKLLFYPLAATSYRSMAKMKQLAPKMKKLKEQYSEDKVKFQQAMMEMYKKEKVNPLGGCLPILIQIPVFMALYWTLLGAVEIRQAPWILWISDLSVADPYYVLPVLMAISMYVQTLLNPPSADPMQDKMMKILPLVFSVMFLFFPAGLVLYWVVNNVLSIAQQWYITRQTEAITDAKKVRA